MKTMSHQISNEEAGAGTLSPFLRLPFAYSFRNFGRFLKNLSILPPSADKFKKSIQNFAPHAATVKAALLGNGERVPAPACLSETSSKYTGMQIERHDA